MRPAMAAVGIASAVEGWATADRPHLAGGFDGSIGPIVAAACGAAVIGLATA